MRTRRLWCALLISLVLATGLPAGAQAAVTQAAAGPTVQFPLDRTHDGLTYAGTAAPTWTRGQVTDAFRAARATSDHLVASGPLVNTTASFTVSAWVRLDSSVGNATVASQDGFALQYFDTVDRWSFRLPGGAVNSTAAPVWHVWTHVAGVYDSVTQRARLWVNGVLQGEQAAAPSTVTGRFAVGAGPAGADLFEGGIDDVRVYDRVASPAEIIGSYQLATNRAHYKLNGTARDEYSGQSGTLSGSATWATGHLTLGATGRLTGPRPALNAGQSYAVLAWVRVATLPTTSRAVVGATGTRFSPYLLAYDGASRKVEFRVVNAALNQGWVARSSAAIAANTWVHVAGLYDSITRQTHLYVNGLHQSTVPNVTAPAPATELVVGANVWAGQQVAGWPGDVDDVRVLAGLPSAEDITRFMSER